jgi:hypothetical protein
MPTSSNASAKEWPTVPQAAPGIAVYNKAIYAEVNDRIVRYPMRAGEMVPSSKPETILSGMPLTGDHPMHPFVIDAKGNLYVDLGSATNSYQSENRMRGSAGIKPCTELETRAGTWRYDANKTGQTFSPAGRFATGLRNGEGFAFDAEGRLFATQHGRDQLSQNWPKLYTVDHGVDLPAEELVQLREDGDRSAITTRIRRSWCWRRSMVETAARRRESAPRSCPPSRGIPRPLGAERPADL